MATPEAVRGPGPVPVEAPAPQRDEAAPRDETRTLSHTRDLPLPFPSRWRYILGNLRRVWGSLSS